MIQASDGGRVYVGKSALEIKLRETPIASAYGNDGPTPTPVVVLTTERMVRDAPIEAPVANAGHAEPLVPAQADQVARRGILNKSMIAGLCLTAFACGIITTVTFDHQRLRALERQVQTQSEALAAAKAAPAAPAPLAEPAPKPVEAAPVAAAPDPVVEQLPPAPAVAAPAAAGPVEAAAVDSHADRPIDATPAATQKPAGPRLTAARTPRPSAPRVAVRRRSVSPAESPAPSSGDSAADWVDPFAQ